MHKFPGFCSTPLSFTYFIWLFLTTFLLTAGAAVSAEPPGLLLAEVYDEQAQLDDYWVSEKLDGVRAYWNGRQLVSRQGNVFTPPDWFIAGFPATPLDGELWLGRGTFDRLSGIVRQRTANPEQWRQVRYMVFDWPVKGLSFNQRLVHLQTLIARSPSPYLQVVEQVKISDHASLMRRLEEIVSQGGEGLMLHRGASHYRRVRSHDLLKLKTYEDAEAVVLAHLPGKGKYSGFMGALLVETPDKRRFKIGTGFSDNERRNPPPIGSTITYKFFGKTNNNLPRFASFLRVREPGM